WSSYADRDSSRLRRLPGPLLVWQRVHDPFDDPDPSSRALLGVSPLLHGQAEAGRHGWPRRALRAPCREGQEVGRHEARGIKACVATGRSASADKQPSTRFTTQTSEHRMAEPRYVGGQAVMEGVMMR